MPISPLKLAHHANAAVITGSASAICDSVGKESISGCENRRVSSPDQI